MSIYGRKLAHTVDAGVRPGGGLTMTAPIYGTSDVPMRVRVLLAAALALVGRAVGVAGGDGPFRQRRPNYLCCSAVEAAIGACLGLGVLVLIHGMTMAGELVGQASGLGIAEVFDPGLDERRSAVLAADVSGWP